MTNREARDLRRWLQILEEEDLQVEERVAHIISADPVRRESLKKKAEQWLRAHHTAWEVRTRGEA